MHGAVRTHPIHARRRHAAHRLPHESLTICLLATGRIRDAEAVQSDCVGVDIIRLGATLNDEAEQGTQRLLAEIQRMKRQRIRPLTGKN